MRRLSWLRVAVATCALGAGAVGCGSDSDVGASGDSGSGDGSISAEAQAAIDAAYEGTFANPPSSSPKPKPGMNIWFIPIAASVTEPDWMEDAADAIGWKLTLFDGKFSPDTVVSGLRQAVADKADGIIMWVVDCAPVKSALQEVDRAGIPVVAVESLDCDETKPGEPALFDAGVAYADPDNPGASITYPEFIRDVFGYTQGLGIIAGTQGEARLLDAKETDFEATILTDDGMRQALEDHCPECEITKTIEFVGADYGAPLQRKVEQALVQHPEANAVVAPGDFPMLEIASAVRGTGRKDSIWVQGGEGQPQIVNLIRKGDAVNAGAGLSIEWEMWSGLDALNRLMHGEQPPPKGFQSGNGVQLFDKDHNMPPPGQRWQPPIDFKAAYLKAWGVE